MRPGGAGRAHGQHRRGGRQRSQTAEEFPGGLSGKGFQVPCEGPSAGLALPPVCVGTAPSCLAGDQLRSLPGTQHSWLYVPVACSHPSRSLTPGL